MPFLIIRNDITKVKADAIVNPANNRLRQGSGTSRAIYLAAGEQELTEACRKIGRCAPGRTAVTPAFRLPAKYIFHTVGPIWLDGEHGEKELLYETYTNTLKLAAEYGIGSIAIPLLSSGNYGYPKERAFRTAVKAIGDFLNNFPTEKELTVYLVIYDPASLRVSKKMFARIDEYINDHYVEEKDEFFPRESRRRSAGLRKDDYGLSNECCEIPDFEAFPLPEGDDEPENRSSELFQAEPTQTGETQAKPVLGKAAADLSGGSLEDLLKEIEKRQTETFSQMLLRLIDDRGLKDSCVYKKANVDRRHFSKIRNDVNYAPNKKTVLAFAIALELSLDETKNLMMRAGYAFSCCSKFDLIVQYYIENKRYDIFEINETLFCYGEQLLGV